MSDETFKLTAAIAGGDEEAVELFYRSYFDWLVARARQATGRDEAYCLDVVQEAVLRIVKTVRPVEGEARFRAWLRLVVQTTAWDYLRQDQRRRARESKALVMAGMNDSPEFDDQRRAWLEKQFSNLDPDLLAMLKMRFEKRWTLARVAGIFGVSVGTIDGRLRRLIATLRERALEDFDD